jgi:tetratricopeptide (TPR) repeat protein
MLKIFILFNLLLSVLYCSSQSDTEVLDFIDDPKILNTIQSDSAIQQFKQMNSDKMNALTNSFSMLPIDRCHHGLFTLFAEFDTLGYVKKCELISKSINAKIDSLIIKIFLNSNKWNLVVNNEMKKPFSSKFTFRLINLFEKRKFERTEKTSHNFTQRYTTTERSYKVQNSFSSSKNCNDGDYFYEIGLKEFNSGNYKKAIQNFTLTLSFNPYDLYALYNLGVSNLKLNKIDKACECFQKGIEYGDVNAEKTYKLKCNK